MYRLLLILSTSLAWAALTRAADDEQAKGKELVRRVCSACHSADVVYGYRANPERWQSIIAAMAQRGAKATDQEFDAILAYAVRYIGDYPRTINVNQASGIDMELWADFSLREGQAFERWRKEHGAFKNWEDLRKIEGVDVRKLEAQRDRIVF